MDVIRAISLTGVLLIATALAGYGARHHAAVPQLGVTVRDFHIGAPRTVSAGELRIAVHNEGPDTHELLLIRTDRASLPLRRDGLTVDEDAIEHELTGEVEGTQPGKTDSKTLDLAPGRYELICNMAGHYRGGMHTTLVVR